MKEKKKKGSGFVTLGIKILIGVTIASNLFIGALLYVNLQASQAVAEKVEEVLKIREDLSSNLREAIVRLQNNFLALPDFFIINSDDAVREAVESQFEVINKETLQGREKYKKLFSRTERRDVSKGKFITKIKDNQLFLAKGLLDESQNFTDAVEIFYINTNSPESTKQQLQQTVQTIVEQTSSANALENKVSQLGALTADAALKAEATRNEILSRVEEIENKEKELSEIKTYQKNFTIQAASFAIIANMAVLFFLVRWIIERPLGRLTRTIEEIRSGSFPEVPFKKRTDQIGTLSGAIENFREALLEIRNDSERRKEEKIIIDELLFTITSVVDELEHKAKELVKTADSLEELAENTEHQSESVIRRAKETASNTASVSESSSELNHSIAEINSQVEIQNGIVQNIIASNARSHEYVEGLQSAIRDIHEIISVVSEITDQTKLLALNATIEAARAGDSGKGFGVVATEVRELSNRTEEATADVMNKVEGIQQAGSMLFGNLETLDAGMTELSQLTSNISSSVRNQQEVTEVISTMVDQTSDNTKEVSVSIDEVSMAATKTRDLATHVHSFSNEIAEQLTNLMESTTMKIDKLAGNET